MGCSEHYSVTGARGDGSQDRLWSGKAGKKVAARQGSSRGTAGLAGLGKEEGELVLGEDLATSTTVTLENDPKFSDV